MVLKSLEGFFFGISCGFPSRFCFAFLKIVFLSLASVRGLTIARKQSSAKFP